MPFSKDDPHINRAGRPPGSTARVNELRERISQVIDECYDIDQIKADLKELKPVERLNLLDKLLKHVLPGPPPENLLDGMSEPDLDRLINYLKLAV
jgi:hypothetical protein